MRIKKFKKLINKLSNQNILIEEVKKGLLRIANGSRFVYFSSDTILGGDSDNVVHYFRADKEGAIRSFNWLQEATR